jgi:hypothetical protein
MYKCAHVSLHKHVDLKVHESRKLLDGLNDLATAQGRSVKTTFPVRTNNAVKSTLTSIAVKSYVSIFRSDNVQSGQVFTPRVGGTCMILHLKGFKPENGDSSTSETLASGGHKLPLKR